VKKSGGERPQEKKEEMDGIEGESKVKESDP